VPPNTTLYDPGAERDTRWHWIQVEAGVKGWHITRGTGTVQINGRHFRADLQLAGANLLLRGSVQHGRVHATETFLNTDATPAAITGKILSQPRGDMLEQRVTFRRGQSGETSYLTLYRLDAPQTFTASTKRTGFRRSES
jgi:hypothetical protein